MFVAVLLLAFPLVLASILIVVAAFLHRSGRLPRDSGGFLGTFGVTAVFFLTAPVIVSSPLVLVSPTVAAVGYVGTMLFAAVGLLFVPERVAALVGRMPPRMHIDYRVKGMSVLLLRVVGAYYAVVGVWIGLSFV